MSAGRVVLTFHSLVRHLSDVFLPLYTQTLNHRIALLISYRDGYRTNTQGPLYSGHLLVKASVFSKHTDKVKRFGFSLASDAPYHIVLYLI